MVPSLVGLASPGPSRAVRCALVLVAVVLGGVLGCGGGDDAGSGGGGGGGGGAGGDLLVTGDGPCGSSTECEGGVCVGLIDGSPDLTTSPAKDSLPRWAGSAWSAVCSWP